MPQLPTIRLASEDDAQAIALLIQGVAHYFLADPSGGESARFLSSFSKESVLGCITSPDFHYLVAVHGDDLIGAAALRDNRHIHHLFVSPAYQRQGIASLLWQHLKESAIRSGNTEGFTVNSSLYAVPVYSRWGFISTTGPQTKNGVSFQPMQLALAD